MNLQVRGVRADVVAGWGLFVGGLGDQGSSFGGDAACNGRALTTVRVVYFFGGEVV